jgi:hypothetical protein
MALRKQSKQIINDGGYSIDWDHWTSEEVLQRQLELIRSIQEEDLSTAPPVGEDGWDELVRVLNEGRPEDNPVIPENK